MDNVTKEKLAQVRVYDIAGHVFIIVLTRGLARGLTIHAEIIAGIQ